MIGAARNFAEHNRKGGTKMQRADKILLCTHGHFGEKLKEAAEMIAGSMERLKTFSLLPGMTAIGSSGF